MARDPEELVDHFLGMLISNILYKEGITSKTIHDFTIEEIREILSNPEKTRFWQTDGLRLLTWESFLGLACSILEEKSLPKTEKNIKAVGAIVVAYMALEESVNSFLQNCLLARGLSLKEINEELNRSLSDKLDNYLLEITGHSLRIERPELWRVFNRAKRVRHPNVHNKVIPTILAEEQYQIPKNPPYFRIASEFVEAIPLINEYLELCYTAEFRNLNAELENIWTLIKEKFGFKPGWGKNFIETFKKLNDSQNQSHN